MIHHDIHQQAEAANEVGKVYFGETKVGQVLMLVVSVLTYLISDINTLDKYLGIGLKFGSGVLLFFTIRNQYHIHRKNQNEKRGSDTV